MRFKEKSIPPCRAGPPAHVHLTNFHLTLVGSRQNQVRSHLGRLAPFSYEHAKFFKGEISLRRASPPNRASSPPYEQPLNV